MLTYTYEGWVLDLSLAHRYNSFSRFDLQHQCANGSTSQTKGIIKDVSTIDFCYYGAWTAKCKTCLSIMSDRQLQQLTAMWNLIKATSEV